MSDSSGSKFFARDWIITIRSHPNVKFYRCSPALIDNFLAILTDPKNHPFASDGVKATIWTAEKLAAEKNDRRIPEYMASPAKQTSLIILIQLDGQFVGYGAATGYGTQNIANVGLQLTPAARGQGLGKLTLGLLLRLSNELKVDAVQMGTMKKNAPMRGLARSLGFEETEETKEFPGWGVVSEILYKDIRREEWRDLEFEIEFLETGPQNL